MRCRRRDAAADPARRRARPRPRRPFWQWYEAHYGTIVGKKHLKKGADAPKEEEKKKASKSVEKKVAARQEQKVLDPNVNSQFDTGQKGRDTTRSSGGRSARPDPFLHGSERFSPATTSNEEDNVWLTPASVALPQQKPLPSCLRSSYSPTPTLKMSFANSTYLRKPS